MNNNLGIECALSTDKHIVIEQSIRLLCGHFTCKSCMQLNDDSSKECLNCKTNDVHKANRIDAQTDDLESKLKQLLRERNVSLGSFSGKSI